MSLKEKLSLPSPTWLTIGLVILIVVGISKLLMWLTPIVAAVIVKTILWVAPLVWKSSIWIAAAVCAIVVVAWRRHKQRELSRVIANGNVIEFYREAI